MSDLNEQLRAEFEVFWRTHRLYLSAADLYRLNDGSYQSPYAQRAWEGFQAARTPASPAVQPVGDERAAFEKFLGRPMMNPAQPSHYNGRSVRYAWEAWQARAALAAPTVQAAPIPEHWREKAKFIAAGKLEKEEAGAQAVMLLRVLLAAPARADAGADAKDAARDVLAERRRQAEKEGRTPKHDDANRNWELSRAAACYALACSDSRRAIKTAPPAEWPWNTTWWKPRDVRSNLVRAGALILAEIERIDRAAIASSAEEVKP